MSAELDALQATLAGEHAATYCYGVLGARTSASTQHALYRLMVDAFALHRRQRDQVAVMIGALGAAAVPAAVSYQVPGFTDTAAGVTAAELNNAALQVEHRIARTYGELIENTTGAVRRWALVALDRSAVRQMEFRGTPEMFPGTTL
jgi:hypothetical protein